MTLPFETCSSICISGQTGSGKTQWVNKFLAHINTMYSKDPPSKVLYCYGIHQDLFDDMERSVPNFRSRQGLPTMEKLDEFTRDKRHKFIIIDDLMHKVMGNKNMELLFTQGTHHKCVILITQILYPGGKHARTIALNTWYMVLMKNIKRCLTSVNTRKTIVPWEIQGILTGL